jgi:hypothetical protein
LSATIQEVNSVPKDDFSDVLVSQSEQNIPQSKCPQQSALSLLSAEQ